MFVTLTDARADIPVLVNLERMIYAYRSSERDATLIVFGQVAAAGGKTRNVALAVTETLAEIQKKRRMASG